MPSPLSALDKRFLSAVGVSLALHLSLLFLPFKTPPESIVASSTRPPPPLTVRLGPPQPVTRIQPSAAPHPAKPTMLAVPKPHRPRQKLMTRVVPPEQKAWTQAEKDEMNQFLNELGTPPKAPSGTELARNALAMARTLGREAQRNDEMAEIDRRLDAANIEPLSLELYFEALFRKLNRSAAMVRDTAHDPGTQLAIVRVTLNSDGTVKNFNVVKSADRQAEIAYVKSVVDRAAPFAAFPAKIRGATDALILQICIQPPRLGGGAGAHFTRLAPGQSCRSET